MRSPEPQQLCVSSWVHSCPPDPPQIETAGRSSLSADDLSAPPTEGDGTDRVEWVPWIVLVMVFEDEEMPSNLSLFASVWFGSVYHVTDQYHTKNTFVWHQQLNMFSQFFWKLPNLFITYLIVALYYLCCFSLLSVTLSGLNCLDNPKKT